MSRSKHYWPCSHDLNDDPDVWEITDLYGDRTIRIVLEVYSILDKKENRWPASKRDWLAIFRKCRIYPKTGWKMVGKLLENRWLMVLKPKPNEFGTIFGSPNYWKYHKKECQQSDFEWVGLGLLRDIPDLPVSSYKNTQRPDSASPGLLKSDKDSEKKKKEDSPMAGMNLIPELKAAADAVYFTDTKKFQGIAKWINQGRKHGWSEKSMAEALRQFKSGHYDLVDEWYPYLDTILDRIVKDRNRDASDEEHRRHLAELKELGNSARNGGDPLKPVFSVVRGLSDAKKA